VRRLRTFLALGLQDKGAFIRAWLYLVASGLGIRFLGLSRTMSWLAPAVIPANPRQKDSGPSAGIQRLPHVSPTAWPRAARWLPVAIRNAPNDPRCLQRSVALLALLRRAGIESDLRIGIGKTQPNLEAHAWVEVAGVPVNDDSDVGQRYRAFGPAINGRS
jgi:hypothetical protein